MVFYDFSFRSLTGAQLGRSVLEDNGIAARLSRAPQGISELGCGYVVQVARPDGVRAAQVLQSRGVGFRRMFLRFEDGSLQEVRDDLF